DLNIVPVFEAVGAYTADRIDAVEFEALERHACPSSGSCRGRYTAKTMSASFAAPGMPLLGSSTMAHTEADKATSAAASGRVLLEAIKRDLKPRDIITRDAIANAVALIMAVGGSTNAVLHYLAIARAAEVEWTLDDFERVRQRVPVLCDLKPSGRYLAVDLHRAGGVPRVLKALLDAGLLHGDCLTITGRTLAEELRSLPAPTPDAPPVIYPVSAPIYPEGHL